MLKQFKPMKSEIEEFYNQLLEDKDGHRYRSWEHCFNAFNNTDLPNDILSLHLGFYLASWGMYRGSSGLLWKDYTIHLKAVEIIKNQPELKVTPSNLYPEISSIFSCSNELKQYYSSLVYFNNKKHKNISATDTLLTKILLGVYGVIPAFDRYFLLGTKSELNISSFSKKNIEKLYEYAREPAHKKDIVSCQSFIKKNSGIWYPPMKILDMYFWQIGFKKDVK